MPVDENWVDGQGNPAGGYYLSQGLTVVFQNGPVQENGENGAQVEDLLHAALQRLRFLNTAADGRFQCAENEQAIDGVETALFALLDRTRHREEQSVEGTHQPHQTPEAWYDPIPAPSGECIYVLSYDDVALITGKIVPPGTPIGARILKEYGGGLVDLKLIIPDVVLYQRHHSYPERPGFWRQITEGGNK